MPIRSCRTWLRQSCAAQSRRVGAFLRSGRPCRHTATSQPRFACAEGESNGFRKLLDVALMPTDSGNYTYPNSTVFVALDDAWNKNDDGTGGCAPW